MLLRPFDHQPDEKFPAEDLWTYQKIGQKGTELTGYPAVSVYHEFRYHPNEVISGVFDGWLYEHLGVFAWTVELWSPQRQAGIAEYKFIDWYREHPPEDDLKLLRWSDEKLAARATSTGTRSSTPQLGPIELGGWNQLYAFRNPPPEYLEREISPLPRLAGLAVADLAAARAVRGERDPLGEGAWRVRLVVQNSGWLPTYVTKKASERSTARGIVAEIEPARGRHAGGRPPARGARPARGPRLQAGRAGRATRATRPTTAPSSSGSCAPGPAPASGCWPATSAPASSAPS